MFTGPNGVRNLMRRCHECGQWLGKKDLFCPRCGAKQPRQSKFHATGQTRADAVEECSKLSEIAAPLCISSGYTL